ncbi:MAG: WHG domain-containing protein [Polyangiaceae bacterium]
MKKGSRSVDEAVTRVRLALESGELTADDLTARQLGAFLGQTTSVLYHHWGSLDGFLWAVSLSGLDRMADSLDELVSNDRGLTTVAESYLEQAFSQPALYALMLEHPFDWMALEKAGLLARERERSMRGWNLLVTLFERLGSNSPSEDARLFQASLHGIARLTATGRMNVGDRDSSDREAALRSARRLARMFLQSIQSRRAER